ncbi:GNAT family N-acetyltransferase [Piscinibacter sp.]|uniref:GNAT family N-acetyltransferase n=1 Tax=Piscinibacter sp. TaxID=1903157 RepID=UPI002BA39832|nr:GNAT family N-acetyltransferase [Albitalea sp.]HUG22574.1 GNAT family N-acetyltransferase [Albitalea sp.]
MSEPEYRIEALDPNLNRKEFTCGDFALDNYFKTQATQDIRRRVAFCFVAQDEGRIIGYYTLSSATLMLDELPADRRKKLPKYGLVPCVLMGRSAVATAHQGKGFGSVLLADALTRALRAEIAAHALIVDAKNAKAASFYEKHGFLACPDQPLKLFLPLVTAAAASQ